MTGLFQTKKFQQSSLWLFYIGLALILFSLQRFEWTGFTPTFIEKVQFILNRLGLGLLVLRLLSLAPAYPRYVLASFCLVAVFWFSHILSVYSGKMNLYYVVLVAAASRGADEKVALKLYLAYLVFFLVICPVSHALGLTGNVLKHIGQLQGGSFGFNNPNYLAMFIAMAASLGLYLFNSRRTATVWIVSGLAAALVAIFTLNRTFTLLMLALPVFYLLFERKKLKPWVLGLLPAACLVISIILAWCYGPGYGNDTFESRFSIPAMVYQKFGLSLFGQDCGLDRWANGVWPYLNIDNGYLNLFICGGVVTGLVAMGFFTHLLYLIGRRGDALLSAVACGIAISGTMESLPFNIFDSFLPLLYMSLVDEFAPESRKAADAVSIAFALGAALYVFMPWHPHRVPPSPYGTVGKIPCPEGYVQAEPEPGSFSGFVESLPLARPDSVVTGYDGVPDASMAALCYQVVDFPLIDKNEQCADVCMRLEAEYLYGRNRFRKIRFADTRGKELRYRFGACRPLFDRYLKKVFGWSSTKSMCASMPVRPLNQIVPGDVFVYDEDAREGKKYGHAVMVAKVAVDPASGRKAVLLIQGSTPACDIHVVANPDAPDLSPWHLLREPLDSSASPVLSFGQTVFYENDLRTFSSAPIPAGR